MKLKRYFLTAIILCCINSVRAQEFLVTSNKLIERVLPQHHHSFLTESLSYARPKDVFELESKGDKIILRGNNGVALASAFYYYLTEFAHCQITWNGTNLNIPSVLPKVNKKIRKETPYEYRYYLNYCTFNYSMSWWDWPRWEK
ncbi:MAG: alpha-N-acetylglucosaminidase, partial [Pedobacter sp.]